MAKINAVTIDELESLFETEVTDRSLATKKDEIRKAPKVEVPNSAPIKPESSPVSRKDEESKSEVNSSARGIQKSKSWPKRISIDIDEFDSDVESVEEYAKFSKNQKIEEPDNTEDSLCGGLYEKIESLDEVAVPEAGEITLEESDSIEEEEGGEFDFDSLEDGVNLDGDDVEECPSKDSQDNTVNADEKGGDSDEDNLEAEVSDYIPIKIPVESSELEEIKKVCRDHSFLDDDRYLAFYKHKLRVVKFLKENVPTIDYDKGYEELENLYVKISGDRDMTIDEFNRKIQSVQSVRNRIVEIKVMSIRDFVVRKKAVKGLSDYLMQKSTEKSADKRSGDAYFHMGDLEGELSLSEAFYKTVEVILENNGCAHEALSRQITCIQEKNKDIQRLSPSVVQSSTGRDDSLIISDKRPAGSGLRDWSEV